MPLCAGERNAHAKFQVADYRDGCDSDILDEVGRQPPQKLCRQRTRRAGPRSRQAPSSLRARTFH